MKYSVEVSPVVEVSLVGSADLAYWQARLRRERLFPTVVGGRAQLLLSSARAKFMGFEFAELSVSACVSRVEFGDRQDGVFLVGAFNSRRFFAFVERTLFSTPYAYAEVANGVGESVWFDVRRGEQALVRAELPGDHAARHTPQSPNIDGWEGPIFLPSPAGIGEDQIETKGRVFFGKLVGQTSVVPFDAARDVFAIAPRGDAALEALVESGFRPEMWHVRPAATHGKSKTTRRGKVRVFANG